MRPAAVSATRPTPTSIDGGLAVLTNNIAPDRCVVKTTGVPESVWRFTGTAVALFESQDDAVDGILNKRVQGGRRVVVIRYGGPGKGGPGMQEMLYPTSFLKGRGLGQACALITDGRFSGGTFFFFDRPHLPEAASGGTTPSRTATGSRSTSRRHDPPRGGR